jgi:hypothetical protein
MNEATLKAGLRAAIIAERPAAVVYRHEDKFTRGIPDFSVTERERVVWAEVKYNRVGRASVTTPLQRLALRRLDGLLIVYTDERNGLKSVSIEIVRTGECVGSFYCIRYDHHFVSAKIAERLNGR